MVTGRGKQLSEGTVPPGEQRSDPDNRAVYRRADIYNADAASDRDLKCRQSTKERWEGKYLCRTDKSPYAPPERNADGIQKGI